MFTAGFSPIDPVQALREAANLTQNHRGLTCAATLKILEQELHRIGDNVSEMQAQARAQAETIARQEKEIARLKKPSLWERAFR